MIEGQFLHKSSCRPHMPCTGLLEGIQNLSFGTHWSDWHTCHQFVSLKKKYVAFFPDPTNLSNCGTCAYLHSLHLMTSFRTKGAEAAAKEPKPTIGKTKVVRGTRTADLMDLALNQGGQGCVFGAPGSFRHPLWRPHQKCTMVNCRSQDNYQSHHTNSHIILSLPSAPHQNSSVLPWVPWPLSIVAILRLRILCQHRQGWQRSRGSLGRCGPTTLAQHSTNLGRSWFLDRHQQMLVFWRESLCSSALIEHVTSAYNHSQRLWQRCSASPQLTVLRTNSEAIIFSYQHDLLSILEHPHHCWVEVNSRLGL